jgi:hypothetical protein
MRDRERESVSPHGERSIKGAPDIAVDHRTWPTPVNTGQSSQPQTPDQFCRLIFQVHSDSKLVSIATGYEGEP